jgi:hypothetical protein
VYGSTYKYKNRSRSPDRNKERRGRISLTTNVRHLGQRTLRVLSEQITGPGRIRDGDGGGQSHLVSSLERQRNTGVVLSCRSDGAGDGAAKERGERGRQEKKEGGILGGVGFSAADETGQGENGTKAR